MEIVEAEQLSREEIKQAIKQIDLLVGLSSVLTSDIRRVEYIIGKTKGLELVYIHRYNDERETCFGCKILEGVVGGYASYLQDCLSA